MITYGLLKSGEINGDRALVLSGAEGGHCDVGDGRKHHIRGEVVEEDSCEEVA